MTTGLGRLFLRSGDTLEPLEEQHLSLEGTLQALLAEQPQLIPLQEIEPELTQPPLLLMREAKVAGMELDHLFVTERAVPILVECKRGANREARREVVAQMIDYAANARLEWRKMINHIRRAFDPSYAATRFHSLNEKYSLEPGGTDLGTYALEKGIWD